ncbi:MAG: DMT family transporter [Muribaculaceae bacterium]|nr:DMT family transporter [Muribaculaceae bacterium]
MWYLIPIFFLGVLTPIQTAANSRLRQSVVSPFIASLVSFSVGTIFLLIVTLCEKGGILIDRELFATLPWWSWLGGICGLWGLTVNIIIFPKLGAMQTALMPMLGQIIMGIVIDSFGLLQSSQFPFTFLRFISVLIILLGMFMVIWQKSSGKKGDNKLLWQAIGFSGGAIFAMQPSMNSLLSIGLYSSVHAAFISFFTATIVLIAIAVIIPSNRVHIPQIFSLDRPWWSWLGGIIGGTFVTGFAFFASKTGIGILLVTSICGLLANSLAIDKFGWFGTVKKRIRPVQYLGLICVVVGIMILRLN